MDMNTGVKLLVGVVLLVILIICCGCGKTAPEQVPDREPDVVLPLEGENAYVIVRPENASKDEVAIVTGLRKQIEDKTGVTVLIKDDFIREGTKFTPDEREICVGKTNREESQRAYGGLKVNDYRIRLDGTRLVICYGSVEAGEKAVELFASEYVSADEKAVKVPSDFNAEALDEYKLDTITLDGRDVSEYVIVGEELFTSSVCETIEQVTGLKLKTSTSIPRNSPVIMLGTLEGLAPEEAGVRLVGGNLVAGTNGKYYDNFSALPLLKRIFAESDGTLAEKDLNRKEKIEVEYRLPFKRGINLSALEQHKYTDVLGDPMQSFAYYLSRPETFKEIREKGFDHVNLALDMPKYYDEAADSLKTSGDYNINDIDGIIRRALDADLYIMFRCHGWWDFSSADPAQCEKCIKMWTCFAEHYKDWDERLAFNLFGEPVYDTNPADKLNEFQHQLVAAIRKTNPTRYLILAITNWNQASMLDTFVPPPGDTHYALAVHCYTPSEFTHQGAAWANHHETEPVPLSDQYLEWLNNDLRQIGAYMQKHPDVPILLNEFGVTQNIATQEDTTRWLSTVTSYCARNGISWTYWKYCDWPSEQLVRDAMKKMGLDPADERRNYDFGARLAFDSDWRHYILEGLGIEVPKK